MPVSEGGGTISVVCVWSSAREPTRRCPAVLSSERPQAHCHWQCRRAYKQKAALPVLRRRRRRRRRGPAPQAKSAGLDSEWHPRRVRERGAPFPGFGPGLPEMPVPEVRPDSGAARALELRLLPHWQWPGHSARAPDSANMARRGRVPEARAHPEAAAVITDHDGKRQQPLALDHI